MQQQHASTDRSQHSSSRNNGDGRSSMSNDVMHDSGTSTSDVIAVVAADSIARLQQLWRELGVSEIDRAREEDALLRDIRNSCERKMQFYQDELELSSKRVAMLRREIAHLRWLFRDNTPHDVRDREHAFPSWCRAH